MDRQRKTSGSSSSTGSYSRSSSGGGMPYDERGPGPRGYGGRGNGGGGRGGRPRQHDRRGGRGGGPGNGRGGHPGMINRPPVILTRDKRQEPPSSMAPGAVSIMQRETSGSHIPTSTTSGVPMRSVTSPALLPTPMESGSHQPPSSLPQGRPQRRGEGLSSSPSSYTPLQPGQGGRGMNRGDAGGGSSRTTNEHSAFVGQTNEMNHSVKLVDKNWHWEDKAVDYMLDQNDYLVVGVLGKQGVGKSTVMSLLAGTRTGSGKPFMFRTQSKEIYESGTYQTLGMDTIVTAERVILIDTQPILSEALLDQLKENKSLVPPGMTPDTYLEVMSLQTGLFLYTVCHVVIVVIDTLDPEVMYKFLFTVERMKANSLKDLGPDLAVGDKQPREYYPQLVFVLNHASPDDFQPFSLREMHMELAVHFQDKKVNIAGGVSLSKSGIVPTGQASPKRHASSTTENVVNPSEVNLHLLPSNSQANDQYMVHTTSRPEKADLNLNPVFSLLPLYTGHPTFQLLAETLRNQIFAMPRPPIRRMAQQQLSEREWLDYAKRIWLTLKKANLYSEYERILRATPPD